MNSRIYGYCLWFFRIVFGTHNMPHCVCFSLLLVMYPRVMQLMYYDVLSLKCLLFDEECQRDMKCTDAIAPLPHTPIYRRCASREKRRNNIAQTNSSKKKMRKKLTQTRKNVSSIFVIKCWRPPIMPLYSVTFLDGDAFAAFLSRNLNKHSDSWARDWLFFLHRCNPPNLSPAFCDAENILILWIIIIRSRRASICSR